MIYSNTRYFHAIHKFHFLLFYLLQNLIYDTPAAEYNGIFTSSIFVKVANETLACSTTMTYYPDPEFISFTPIRRKDNVYIIVEVRHIFRIHAQHTPDTAGQHLPLLSF